MKQKVIDHLDEIFLISGLLSLVFLGFGLRNIDNYLNWFVMSLTLVFSGAVLGFITYMVLGFFIENIQSYRNTNNISVLTTLVVCFSFSAFGIGVLLNEYASKRVYCKSHTISDFGESSNRSKEYYIFVNINGKMKRLSFGKSFKKTHKAGDRIQLCVVTGLLGYQYVTMDTNSKFKPNDF